jgi:hypothetical protein
MKEVYSNQIDTKRWWPGAESNCRHADFQSAALPTELPGHIEPHDKTREEAEL